MNQDVDASRLIDETENRSLRMLGVAILGRVLGD